MSETLNQVAVNTRKARFEEINCNPVGRQRLVKDMCKLMMRGMYHPWIDVTSFLSKF